MDPQSAVTTMSQLQTLYDFGVLVQMKELYMRGSCDPHISVARDQQLQQQL